MSKQIKQTYASFKIGESFSPTDAAGGLFRKECVRELTPREKAGLNPIFERGQIVGFVWAIDGRPYHTEEHPYDIDGFPKKTQQ